MPLQIVVGVAVVRSGAVLAARRARPHSTAGSWEFPGGKVEPGETDEAALGRECLEELSMPVVVGRLLASSPVRDGLTLHVYLGELPDGAQPRLGPDHDELRWLTADELDTVEWLPADLAAVEQLRRLL